jgi:tetratricopeptide (TPR) repeat protein
MKQMYTFIFLVLASVSAMAQDISSDMKAAFANQDYIQAVELSKSCYDADSNNIACLRILATAANKSGDQATAKQYLHILEQKDSSNTDVYIQLASIYEQQQQLPKAIKYYTILNKIQPDNPLYYRRNAHLYKGYGDHLESFRLYAKANKLNPRDVLTLKGLAELSIGNEQMQIADSLINVALELDSMNISINYLLARSKYKQKQYYEVIEVFDRIRGQVDLNSYNNKMLGYAYLQIDSVDLAISKFQLSLVDDNSPEKLHYYLATAYEKKGNMGGALEHYEKAVESGISPNLDLYHRNVGRLALKQNKHKKAFAAYKDAYKYGNDPVLLYYIAAAADNYYKDKSIAIGYYKKYMMSNHRHQEYRDYVKKRVRYLKEAVHQKKS